MTNSLCIDWPKPIRDFHVLQFATNKNFVKLEMGNLSQPRDVRADSEVFLSPMYGFASRFYQFARSETPSSEPALEMVETASTLLHFFNALLDLRVDFELCSFYMRHCCSNRPRRSSFGSE